ncbi:MAG TPA: hypothetical protein VFI16_10350 [Anaeromyxobacteraceae bacterium]|nr:hypothetical protein [Anaeromyxobacteraceae bacterium]
MGAAGDRAGAVAGGGGRAAWRAGWMLAIASLAAVAGAAAVVGLVLHGDFLTGAADAIARLAFEHEALAVAAATSPIFAALLVGYGYMQRGIRRRAAEKAAAAAAPEAARAAARDAAGE